MKKFLSIVLSAAMIFSLAACGGSETGGTKAAEGTKAATEGTKAAGTTDDKASGDTVKIGMMISLTGSGVQCGEECHSQPGAQPGKQLPDIVLHQKFHLTHPRSSGSPCPAP